MKTEFIKMANGPATDNPFLIDDYNMGTRLSEELYYITDTHPNVPLRNAYIYNIKSGERFEVKITT